MYSPAGLAYPDILINVLASLHATKLVNYPMNKYLFSIKHFYNYSGCFQRGLCYSSDGNGGSI